jgi:M6 family metalloprotease-like protein
VPPGVYIEPVPRRSGIRLPADAAQLASAGAPALGIPATASFFTTSQRAAREGVLSMLLIPALFSDSPDPAVTTAEMQRILFAGPTAQGTLTEFYRAASRGRFEVRGTVAPWVRTTVSRLEAAGQREGHGWIGPRMAEYVAQAIHLADASIDFRQFDNNGPDGIPNSGDDDGWVDGLTVRSTEVSGSCGGPGPWPHFGAAREGGQPIVTQDLRPSGQPIRVQVYISDSVLDCTGTQPEGISVLAHEIGHLIGLPDLYRLVGGTEREDRAWTVGCFDLMAGGSWGCGRGPKVVGFGPTLLSPFMKWRLGWIEFEDVSIADRREFVLEPSQNATKALRVALSPGSLEQFIVEYRPATGFDRWLPAGGVLVYHHDAFTNERPVPASQPRPFWYHLVEADGDNALRKNEEEGGNRGAATDVFARNGDVATIGDATIPSTRDHLGGSSTVTFHSIRIDGGVARVVLSAGSGMQIASRAVPDTVNVLMPLSGVLSLSGGVSPFTATMVAGKLPDGITATVQGASLRVAGAPLELGTFAASWIIADAAGLTIADAIRMTVADLPLPLEQLMGSLAGPSTLDDRTRTYLDRANNQNGRYDVGDLRAYLVRTRQLR